MVYEGKEKYIFASYAHDDADRVLPIIRALQEQGCRIWCDEDLIVGENYNAAIARHLHDCSAVLYFLSRNWMESEYCRNEATVGIEHFRKNAALLYLEDCPIHYEVLMLFAGKHAIWKDKPDFMQKLLLSPSLKDCFEGASPVSAEKKPVQRAPRKVPKPTAVVQEKTDDNDVAACDYDENVRALRETLESFNIRLKGEVGCTRGPTFTRYEVKPEIGVSVRSIINRIDDISLALRTSVRIEAPIPGKAAIGIEVPNRERETVMLEKLWENEKYRNATEPLTVPVGIDVTGELHLLQLTKAPHMLIGGATGSGKSKFMEGVLLSLMRRHTPDELRLLLIDPKQVEYFSFANMPHLLMPVITDCREAVAALGCLVQEMERRYSLLSEVGARNIEAYNKAVQNSSAKEYLPYIVVAIDELADLKMACRNNDVEAFLCRLAQKARAAGIHVIVGTQRPTVNIITGTLKCNMPTRMAFRVSSQVDSRTILDQNGAECLVGKGDALFAPVGRTAPVRVQCAFISDNDVERVVGEARSTYAIRYDEDFMSKVSAEVAAQINQESAAREQAEAESKGDSKFAEALLLVANEKKVATSLLQRRLGIGYGRAVQLIDAMEELGYVTAPEGNKPRNVLITPAEAVDLIAKLKNNG